MIPSSARRAIPLVTVALLAFAGQLWAADPLPSAVTKALAATSRRAEVAMLEEACTTTTDPTMLPWVELYAGEARRLNGEPALARAHFERVAGDFPAHRAKNPAVLGMALVDAGGAASGNVLATLQLVADDNVPDTMNADRYLLVAQARAREGAPASDVAGLAQRAVKYAQADKEQSKRISKAAADLPAAAPAAAPPPIPSGPADQVAITQIRAAVASGDFPTAGRLAAAFPTTYAGSPYLKEASYAVKRAAKGVRTDPKRVVVLLPLSGEYAQPGSALKAAIELAADRAKANVVLDFADTAGKADQCVAALEKAVIDQGAAVAIGPLLREEAMSCAPAAQALRVPMLTLSSSTEPLGAGDLIFHGFPSTDAQAAALVEEVAGKRGMTKFAVLHPQTTYGEVADKAFTAAVKARGGTIVRDVPYDPKLNDFRTVAKQVGKPAGASSVEYEAIFIPDSYQRVALIAAALAFEELPVGRFRAHPGDAPITLLGLNAWNNDDLARRGGTYVLDSIFVDAFDARASDPLTQSFVTSWADRNAGPPSVVEASGYDALLTVVAAMGVKAPSLGEALAQVQLTQGLTGLKSFDGSREGVRDWRLLTVDKAGIIPLYGNPNETVAPAPPPR